MNKSFIFLFIFVLFNIVSAQEISDYEKEIFGYFNESVENINISQICSDSLDNQNKLFCYKTYYQSIYENLTARALHDKNVIPCFYARLMRQYYITSYMECYIKLFNQEGLEVCYKPYLSQRNSFSCENEHFYTFQGNDCSIYKYSLAVENCRNTLSLPAYESGKETGDNILKTLLILSFLIIAGISGFFFIRKNYKLFFTITTPFLGIILGSISSYILLSSAPPDAWSYFGFIRPLFAVSFLISKMVLYKAELKYEVKGILVNQIFIFVILSLILQFVIFELPYSVAEFFRERAANKLG